ncbi:hypothetical protein QA943_00525 [Streptomyces sp. B21-097]|uniref:hypothetical protein n=1 Tax=Streptomyces sp. B21-097 TaxID=3039414 RepID=UPI002FEEB94C
MERSLAWTEWPTLPITGSFAPQSRVVVCRNGEADQCVRLGQGLRRSEPLAVQTQGGHDIARVEARGEGERQPEPGGELRGNRTSRAAITAGGRWAE